MDCRTFEEILAEYEDRSLKPAVQAQADRHLTECNSCRSLLEIAHGRQNLLSEQEEEEMAGSILSRTSGSPCHRAQELVCAFVDNTLDRESADLVSEHLDHCTSCRSLASGLRELSEILPQLAEVRPDERLTDAILAATIGSKPRLQRPLPLRLQEWWSRLVQRPRFSFEAAYVGTLVVALFVGNPFPTVRTLSVHTLEAVSRVLPRDLEKNSSELLLRLKVFALDLSSREQRVREWFDQARVHGETVAAASINYQFRYLQAWHQKGLQSIRGFLKRLWPGSRKSGPQTAGS
jgi:predicted anti-sigma-YlaC factor YlaD